MYLHAEPEPWGIDNTETEVTRIIDPAIVSASPIKVMTFCDTMGLLSINVLYGQDILILLLEKVHLDEGPCTMANGFLIFTFSVYSLGMQDASVDNSLPGSMLQSILLSM